MTDKELNKNIQKAQKAVNGNIWTRIRYALNKRSDYIALALIVSVLFCIGTIFPAFHNYYFGLVNLGLYTITCILLITYLIVDIDWSHPLEPLDDSNFLNKNTLIYRGFIILFSVVWGVILVTNFIPVQETNTATKLENNTTYVLYSDSCKYCLASKDGATKAVTVYNDIRSNYAWTSKTAKFVDIDSNTKLAKQLRDQIQVKGSIVYYHNDQFTVLPYTQKTKNGKPVNTSANYVYNQIVKVQKQ